MSRLKEIKSEVYYSTEHHYSKDILGELEKILSEELARSIDAQIMQDLKPFIRESKIDSILDILEKYEQTRSSE
jgi:hypothetical protein